MLKEPMPLINLTFVHGQTLEEARRRLEKAVHEVTSQFGGVRRVEWAADRNRVKLEGAGVWVEMWVDAQNVHATGDIPILGELLGGPLTSRLKQVLQQAFQKKLR
jgi:Putative polyhydroxyalkanoic acid system protein (PHA_gran_rgn)